MSWFHMRCNDSKQKYRYRLLATEILKCRYIGQKSISRDRSKLSRCCFRQEHEIWSLVTDFLTT